MEGEVNGVNLSNVTINGTGTLALQEQDPGTASATNVVATNVAQANAGNAPGYSCEGSGFTITDGGGNSGISPTQWNGWPAPVYPPYPGSGSSGGGSARLSASPTSLAFGSEAVGSTTAAQKVTITNTGSAAASVSSVTAGAPFAQTSSLAELADQIAKLVGLAVR